MIEENKYKEGESVKLPAEHLDEIVEIATEETVIDAEMEKLVISVKVMGLKSRRIHEKLWRKIHAVMPEAKKFNASLKVNKGELYLKELNDDCTNECGGDCANCEMQHETVGEAMQESLRLGLYEQP